MKTPALIAYKILSDLEGKKEKDCLYFNVNSTRESFDTVFDYRLHARWLVAIVDRTSQFSSLYNVEDGTAPLLTSPLCNASNLIALFFPCDPNSAYTPLFIGGRRKVI